MALTQVRPAGLIFPTDSILQVKSATQTAVASFASSSTSTFVDLSGLSVSITPASTDNKILVMFNVNCSQTTTATLHVRIVRDSTASTYSGTFYVNRMSNNNSDSDFVGRTASNITVMEIAG
jgi:hypothetical protein